MLTMRAVCFVYPIYFCIESMTKVWSGALSMCMEKSQIENRTQQNSHPTCQLERLFDTTSSSTACWWCIWSRRRWQQGKRERRCRRNNSEFGANSLPAEREWIWWVCSLCFSFEIAWLQWLLGWQIPSCNMMLVNILAHSHVQPQ